ncbi:hypothetical protein [Nocardia sp. 348MFTsu5.1]|uniref:hypothetical protein n=1 Tax=Nocardia sp. 348MFTsu5.1 TaxID=1172185 RepID=UPI00039C301B|nr:hypothetical protein [Nocardia sp. 348MFTsu5.1]
MSIFRGRHVVVAVALLAVLQVGLMNVPLAGAAPMSINPPQWTEVHSSGDQKYAGVAVTPSVPIRMSDGTVLRGDIYRPADASGRATADKNPVIVNLTPYNKLIGMIAGVAMNIPGLSKPLTDFLAGIDLSGSPI